MRRQVHPVAHLFCLLVTPENKPPGTQYPDWTVDSLPTLRKIRPPGASVAILITLLSLISLYSSYCFIEDKSPLDAILRLSVTVSLQN